MLRLPWAFESVRWLRALGLRRFVRMVITATIRMLAPRMVITGLIIS